MEQNNNSTSAKIVTSLIIGLIVGFVAGAFWQDRRNSELVSLKEEETTEVSVQETAAENKSIEEMISAAVQNAGIPAPIVANAAILVGDQTAGGTVVISQLVSTEPVWVSVREERQEGFGNILGARKMAAGISENVVVELLRPTASGAKYFVVLYRDVGDPAFNYREDILLENTKSSFVAK